MDEQDLPRILCPVGGGGAATREPWRIRAGDGRVTGGDGAGVMRGLGQGGRRMRDLKDEFQSNLRMRILSLFTYPVNEPHHYILHKVYRGTKLNT